MEWKSEYDDLAIYHSEVARGLVHTRYWEEKMLEIQQRYNTALHAAAERVKKGD